MTLLKIIINIYLLIVILFHCPIVLLQLYSQLQKLCRKNPIPDPAWEGDDSSTANRSSRGSLSHRGSILDSRSRVGMIEPTRWQAFCYNLKKIFYYRQQSQEYLYRQLFEDSERKSMRGSLIFNHMQIIDEVRMGGDQQLHFGPGSIRSPDPKSPKGRNDSLVEDLPFAGDNNKMSFKDGGSVRSNSLSVNSEVDRDRENKKSMVHDSRVHYSQ